ncbi:DNA topoisomerase 3-alpha [Pleodorina starrii]|nr:DNA topoisomerase 3-alpha [Pleodorina starrii]
MGLWSFAAHRIVDFFIPGAGLLLDAADAYELINELQSTGELSVSNAVELSDTIRSMHEQGKEIHSGMIVRHVRKCGICHQPGHNRRTCPQG